MTLNINNITVWDKGQCISLSVNGLLVNTKNRHFFMCSSYITQIHNQCCFFWFDGKTLDDVSEEKKRERHQTIDFVVIHVIFYTYSNGVCRKLEQKG